MINWEKVNHERYDEFLNNIIQSRGQWSEEVLNSERGCERHHIIPRCAGGEPKKLTNKTQYSSNIIWLYPAEHFIVHEILADDNPTNYSLIRAFLKMAYQNNEHQERIKLTPEQYEKLRNYCILANQLYWENLSDEDKLVIKEKSKNTKAKQTIEEHNSYVKKQSDNMKGKLFYNNGIEQHRYLEGQQPDGWVRGRLPLSDKVEAERKRKEKETKSKRTEKDKENSLKKYRNTVATRTDEQNKIISQNRQNAINSRSIERKQEISNKMKASQAKVNQQERYKKYKQTVLSRTPERQLEIHNNKSLATSMANNGNAKKIRCIENGEIFGCKKEVMNILNISLYLFNKLLIEHLADINGNHWEEIINDRY